MQPSDDIHAPLVRVLAQSLGASEDEITLSARLSEDLGAESIDFLDIVFRLEREFRIKIPGNELFPESVFGDNSGLVTDGRVTDEGMRLLRSRMPYADLDPLERTRELVAVSDLFTVDLVARYVAWKLAQSAASSADSSPAADNLH